MPGVPLTRFPSAPPSPAPQSIGPSQLSSESPSYPFSGEPAWRLLETTSREDLAAMLAKYGDGQDTASAERVADAIALSKVNGQGVKGIAVEAQGSSFPDNGILLECSPIHILHQAIWILALHQCRFRLVTQPTGVPKTTAAFAALVAACRIGGDYQRMHAAKLTFQAWLGLMRSTYMRRTFLPNRVL